MSKKCNHLCKNLLISIVLWLADRLGLAVMPPGWMMFDPEVAKERGIEEAVIDANPDGDKGVQA